ncbi:hypothetical protein [Microbispora rosea]|uniref:hypothetical protein n=1 Tax=Microbispora rosea TaxID=58117 RepID=UPI003426457D
MTLRWVGGTNGTSSIPPKIDRRAGFGAQSDKSGTNVRHHAGEPGGHRRLGSMTGASPPGGGGVDDQVQVGVVGGGRRPDQA